jgi:low affinity Fe/Cu permease
MKTTDSAGAGLRAPFGGGFPPAASPSPQPQHPLIAGFDHLATRVTRWVGSPAAFCIALAMVVAWALLGPVFGYSEGWQLVINTGTTIVTFLMVFLIQQSQNKDSRAVHLKLDELLASNCEASNRMIGIEDLDEQALRRLAAHYTHLAERAQAGRRGGARIEQPTGSERAAPAAP